MHRRYSSSVSPKGQITLPIEIRRELDINPRDHVVLELADGYIRVIPETSSLESVFASVPALPIAYKDGDLERIAKDERMEKYVAELRKQ